MAELPIDIDRIVREVLAELANPGVGDAPAARPAKPPTAPPSEIDGEVVVASRVVTLDELGGRLKGLRRLVVSPGAVLTPAVRDALRENNVALAFEAAPGQPASGAGRLVLVTAFTSFDPGPLVDALRNDGLEACATTSNCLIETTDSLAGRLRESGTLGLVLTSQVAAALCLANRLAGVRAVTGDSAAMVAKTAASVGANLLVLDPRGKSVFQLKQMIGEFFGPGPRRCPDALKMRLA
jgi:hypothetical protein